MSAAPQLFNDASRPCVLFVDDDAGNRQAFQTTFRRSFDVLLARDLNEAWEHLATNHVHVVIADQRMPYTTGSQLLTLIRGRYPQIRRMLITGYADIEAIIEAVNLGGVSRYIAKPWNEAELTSAMHQAFDEVKAEEDQKAYTERLVTANRQLEFALRQRLIS
ncbi:MAG: response regulator [Flavobacteriales bacterium]|jgi:DNA-binding NtrC family response regulator|nr:response regulator [Flavobacteriales bacterium]MBK6549571.1 response regulator [Flavobacteriales bacterium]MBK6883841.1 response regulator [Flavobacteriales bacterium]MBK7100233.1 response regulator [Flavobacteriales bacterium]MBK7110926.1 response regulator [Flavobacteriales bacterium]